jgi:hypothetical protein
MNPSSVVAFYLQVAAFIAGIPDFHRPLPHFACYGLLNRRVA